MRIPINQIAGMLILTVGITLAESEDLTILSYEKPGYPNFALTANAHGDVNVELVLNEDGTVNSSKLISGSPLLQQAALANVKTWKFASNNSGPLLGKHVSVTYEFKMEGETQCGRGPVRVTFVSYNRVQLTANPMALCDPGAVLRKRRRWYWPW